MRMATPPAPARPSVVALAPALAPRPSLPLASPSAGPFDPSALHPPPPSTIAGEPSSKPKNRRTRQGCLTCRKRKKLCNEEKPRCGGCTRLALECVWEDKERAAEERRRKREERKRLKELEGGGSTARDEAMGQMAGSGTARHGVGSSDVESALSSNPRAPCGMSPHPPNVSLPATALPHAPHASPSQLSWTPFLGSFAPTPYPSASDPSDISWITSFPNLIAPPRPQPRPAPILPAHSGVNSQASHQEMGDLDFASWLPHADAPLSFSSLVRSPSPARPFTPDLSSLFPSLDNLDVFNVLTETPSYLAASSNAANSLSLVASSPQQPLASTSTGLAPRSPTSTITRAASFLASSDFAFTQAYLLSHYTTSLAQHVSIASSSSPSSSRPSTSHSRSTAASANLFLSLVPHAHRNPFLMHSILAWSAANLAAASDSKGASPSASGSGARGGAAGPHSAMGSLSDELGVLAEGLLSEMIPLLEAGDAGVTESGRALHRPGSSQGRARPLEGVEWEPVLAGCLMLVQAAICRGDVKEMVRVRLRKAAQVINLVGGIQQCRSPLARQLLKNLLYHDVLSSSATKDGLLLDYSSLRTAEGRSPQSSRNSTAGGKDGADDAGDEEYEEDEEVLDTLMGIAESVFLLIGRITSLAREKRQAVCSNGGLVPEDELAVFLQKVDDIKGELELEKERMDGFLVDRPELEPHRYFHEVFRLAALLYLQMMSELPPRSYPVLLLVRKMLSLTEVIVSESLPGLCSMHWPLYLVHLNSTPLLSPHAELTDRQRSTRLFDKHEEEFTFLNTKRSRALIGEAWRRSSDGKVFVDPDSILEEWKWDLNFA
ncbi:hypothetical protein JCM1841_004761 [Sporobolomyces salmonicolor]